MSQANDTATALKLPATSGIGSLPHHNLDAALEFALRSSVPYLPQIPIRNPWEYLIAQALEGMPGLRVEKDGETVLDGEVWKGRRHDFDERLLHAFSHASDPHAFSAFEPSSAASSSWQPFLWELEERGVRAAKYQLAGPMTAQWALRLADGTNASDHPEVAVQIFRLVLARAIAMGRRLKETNILPVLFFDEPGLYGFLPDNPRHVLGFQELKIVIQTVRKEGISVGLHCCSNTDWEKVLGLGLDWISIDVDLSLSRLLEAPSAKRYLEEGGRLALGVIPTGRGPALPATAAEELLAKLAARFETCYPGQPSRVRTVLRNSLFTPACGLALHSPADAEHIQAQLDAVLRLVQ